MLRFGAVLACLGAARGCGHPPNTRRLEQSWRCIAWRALLDDEAGALDEREQACALRNINLMYAAVDPAYDRIRQHPRFQRVLEGMGLTRPPPDGSQNDR